MLERAYSVFAIKAFDEDQRIVEGIASTPTVDRGGDQLASKGARFKLPMPFKWQHKNTVGQVIAATVTDAGIAIRAILPKITEPGLLKEQVDYAWQSIQHKLTRGLSIGWHPLEATPNRKGGLDAATWEWVETSAVDIPMNAEATITLIKTLDTGYSQAALRPDGSLPAGVSASRRSADRADTRMKLNEQIEALTNSRIATSDRMKVLMSPDVVSGDVELDEAQSKEYDGLVKTLSGIDTRLERLEALERADHAPLAPVAGGRQKAGSLSRGGYAHVSVTEPELPPGILFTRSVICKVASRMEYRPAFEIAKERYPSHPSIEAYLRSKTLIPGGTTTGTGSGSPQTGWGDALANTNTLFAAGFMDYLRPGSIVGRLNLQATPFNSRVQSQTTGGSARWVGQGLAKPVTKYDFDEISLGPAKLAAICVLADELIRFSTPNAETVVRNQLARTINQKLDADFIDPDVAAVANVSPASITRGITVLNPTGTALANAMTDIATMVGTFVTNNQNLDNLAWIMPNSVALNLGMMLTTVGARAFPDINVRGGTLAGYPVVTSQAAYNISTSPTDGNLVILINQSEIFLADDGAVTVDASDQASIEMSDNPENEAVAVVSMYQTNQIALRAERFINWARGRTSSVVVMGDVRWAA